MLFYNGVVYYYTRLFLIFLSHPVNKGKKLKERKDIIKLKKGRSRKRNAGKKIKRWKNKGRKVEKKEVKFNERIKKCDKRKEILTGKMLEEDEDRK